MFRNSIAVAALVAFLPSFAPAATVTIEATQYTQAQLGTAMLARDAFIGAGTVIAEDFEGFTACTGSNGAACDTSPLDTAVGEFTGIGPGITTGGSQVDPKDKVVVRTGAPNPFGRFNVTTGGANWLDSNDLTGIEWSLPGDAELPLITRIAFFLTDIDDVGKVAFTLTALIGGVEEELETTFQRPNTGLPNGNLHLVMLSFDNPVDSLRIQLVNGKGDGFGLDGARVAVVPLPAAGFLLLGAIGGLVVVRRRKAAA